MLHSSSKVILHQRTFIQPYQATLLCARNLEPDLLLCSVHRSSPSNAHKSDPKQASSDAHLFGSIKNWPTSGGGGGGADVQFNAPHQWTLLVLPLVLGFGAPVGRYTQTKR